MKKLLSILLALCLLLCGCQTAAPEETEQTITYDWMAGECMIDPQRSGLFRPGEGDNCAEATEDGLYFTYTMKYDFGSYLLYLDHESDTVVKLCGRPDCDHTNHDCNSYLFGASQISYYDGYLYALAGSDAAPKLVRMNPDGTDRVTILDTARFAGENGYSTCNWPRLGCGVFTVGFGNLNKEGIAEAEGFYFKLDGSMEAPEVMNADGVPMYNCGEKWMCWTDKSQYGSQKGGYYIWDPKTNTAEYATDMPAPVGWYGEDQAFYYKNGAVVRLDYATRQEEILFETGLQGNYRAVFYPDCIIVRAMGSNDVDDPNLYIYNWAFEQVAQVELDYPRTTSADGCILIETWNRLILTDTEYGLPRYYIEKSELGTGNVKIHELNLPDFEAELAEIEERLLTRD